LSTTCLGTELFQKDRRLLVAPVVAFLVLPVLQEFLEKVDALENQEHQALLVSQVDHHPTVSQPHLHHAKLAPPDPPALPDILDLQVRLDRRDLMETQERTVLTASPGNRDHPVLQDKLELTERREKLEDQDQAHQLYQESLELLVMQDHKDLQDPLEPPVTRDSMDSQEPRDLQDPLDLRERLVNQERTDPQVLPAQLETRVFAPSTAHWTVVFSSKMERTANKFFPIGLFAWLNLLFKFSTQLCKMTLKNFFVQLFSPNFNAASHRCTSRASVFPPIFFSLCKNLK